MNKIEIKDEIFSEIEEHIPGVKGKWGGISNQNRDFVETILYLAKNKSIRSKSFDWTQLAENRASYNRRFTNWRKQGIWEIVLCILLRYKEFYWLANPFIYDVFLTNYDLVTTLNIHYLLTDETDRYLYYNNYGDEEKWKYMHTYTRYEKQRTAYGLCRR